MTAQAEDRGFLAQEPEDGSDELQADSDEALFGKSDESESDSALYGNALLQQEPEDGSDELQADSDEALFGKSDESESDSALYGTNFLQVAAAPADELAKEMTHDLEMNFNKIAPFGKEDTAKVSPPGTLVMFFCAFAKPMAGADAGNMGWRLEV